MTHITYMRTQFERVRETSGYHHKGVRYADVFRLDYNGAKCVLRHGDAAWKIGDKYFHGEASSIRLLANAMQETITKVQ